jgi:RNA 2',3'-cyclic 3'-phosphodiesterase
VFDIAASFAGSQAPVLRGNEAGTPLTTFRNGLGLALERAGQKAQLGNTAHMTLAYGDHKIAEQRIEPIHWAAQDLVLIDCLTGKGIHRHLDRWPLVQGLVSIPATG